MKCGLHVPAGSWFTRTSTISYWRNFERTFVSGSSVVSVPLFVRRQEGVASVQQPRQADEEESDSLLSESQISQTAATTTARWTFESNYQQRSQCSTVCGIAVMFAVTGDDARLTAIVQVNLGKPAPECLHSGVYWSKGAGGGEW